MVDDRRLVAGRYRPITRLGSGGMGVVWQAYDERLHRTVAVKKLLLPAELTESQTEEAKRRAMREGRIAAKLQHPNAIMVYDVTEDGGQPYLIMEYLPSKSLSDVLAERGPLPPLEVAEIGHQAAAALAAAHAAGVIHRDVKPGNVLLGHDGTVKITDFGISRAVEDVTGTTTGLIAGTPAYLSPEVAKGARATFAADVFSLGATLYTAIEGGPPFGSGENAMALLYKVASGDVRPPSQAGPMTEALTQLLRTEPELRPTMAQARDLLAEVTARPSMAGAMLGAGLTAPITPRMDRVAEPSTGRPRPLFPDRTPTPPPTRVAPAAPPVVAPAAPVVAAATPDGPPPPRRDRRRLAVLAAAAIVVLALLGGVLLLLDGREPGAGTAAQPQTSASAPPSAAPTSDAAGTTQSQAPAPPPATTTAQPPAATTQPPAAQPPNPQPQNPQPQNAVAAITGYYGLMPNNLEAGWARLTPKYQRSPAGGWSGYQNFWNQMRSVQVSGVSARQANVVEATVQYTFDSGKVVRERHSYTLVSQGGQWLIDESRVLSSVTL